MPDLTKRSYLLPPGCKDLIDVLHGVKPKQSIAPLKVNGRIRARKVRVIDDRGVQLGIVSLAEALRLAQSRSLDLVEIAPRAKPPICRIIDYGRFRFQWSQRPIGA